MFENLKKGVQKMANVIITRRAGDSLEDMTKDATATPPEVNKGKTAYVNGKKITGTRESFEDEARKKNLTAEASHIAHGYTAIGKNGQQLVGTHYCPSCSPYLYTSTIFDGMIDLGTKTITVPYGSSLNRNLFVAITGNASANSSDFPSTGWGDISVSTKLSGTTLSISVTSTGVYPDKLYATVSRVYARG